MLTDQIAASIRHHWWLFLLRGVAAIVFGLLALLWPGATVIALMAFVAAYALVDGIVTTGAAVRMRMLFDRWWLLLIQGLISMVRRRAGASSAASSASCSRSPRSCFRD